MAALLVSVAHEQADPTSSPTGRSAAQAASAALLPSLTAPGQMLDGSLQATGLEADDTDQLTGMLTHALWCMRVCVRMCVCLCLYVSKAVCLASWDENGRTQQLTALFSLDLCYTCVCVCAYVCIIVSMSDTANREHRPPDILAPPQRLVHRLAPHFELFITELGMA